MSRLPAVYGPASGRPFDPEHAGGPVRRLSTNRVRITDRGIAVVERHLRCFGPDPDNAGMVGRLRAIAAGRLAPTAYDRNFYAHELREFVRFRRNGWPDGVPADRDESHALWNNAHTAALEDYRLSDRGTDHPLYHPDFRTNFWPRPHRATRGGEP